VSKIDERLAAFMHEALDKAIAEYNARNDTPEGIFDLTVEEVTYDEVGGCITQGIGAEICLMADGTPELEEMRMFKTYGDKEVVEHF